MAYTQYEVIKVQICDSKSNRPMYYGSCGIKFQFRAFVSRFFENKYIRRRCLIQKLLNVWEKLDLF